MKLYSEPFPHIGEPFAVCIGKFDGVHAGHRLILDTLLHDAGRRGLASVVYSFEPFNGAARLTTRGEKQALFSALGIDALITAELTDAYMAMPAEDFVVRLAACGGLRAVAVGRDFRFGAGAAGGVALLREMGGKHRFTVHAVDPVLDGGRPVSSTWIRECVAAGDMERATRLLGREYALSGTVVNGKRVGRLLGFRTANLPPPEGKVMPPFGVYAAWADTDEGSFPAMTNIGVRPTVMGEGVTVESHLIGFEGDLYGREITLRFVGRIRDEMNFGSVERLSRRLREDREAVRALLAGGGNAR